MLELTGVHSGYGQTEVLRDISLDIQQGEVVSILGANGAGKTTLLKTILGLVHTTSGEIHFEGQSITELKPNQVIGLGIAIAPEGKRLFPKMTVVENLRMGAYTEPDEATIRQRIEEAMDLFPRLRERADQLAGTLSGGEQQMCAIGRALMSQPRLLLLDEPSFGLAPVLVEETFEIIERINEAGTTVLLVEQNAFKSLSVSHRAYVLQKGEIILSGDVDEVRHSPAVQKAYLLS